MLNIDRPMIEHMAALRNDSHFQGFLEGLSRNQVRLDDSSRQSGDGSALFRNLGCAQGLKEILAEAGIAQGHLETMKQQVVNKGQPGYPT
jgi:hypothetical protein